MYQIGKEEEVKDGFKQDKSFGDPNTIYPYLFIYAFRAWR